MIRALMFLIFDCMPPCQVRVFVRFMAMFDRCSMYGLYDCTLWTAYASASSIERDYLDARYPEYVSIAKAAVLARIRSGVRA